MTMAGHGNITRSYYSYDLESFQEKIWSILLLQIILAIAGNGYAMYHFLVQRRWNTSTVYSFNLTISDLLYAISLLPIVLYYYPPKDWKFGLAFCRLDRFFFFCNLYGSTFFVACISLNRYVAVAHPFFAHGSMKLFHAKLLSGGVWLLVIVFSAPVLRFSTLNIVTKNTTYIIQCLGSASDEQLAQYWPYSLFLLGFGFGVPFILTSVSCGAIIYKIHHNCNITNEKKRRMKTLVSAVVILYIIFYLPFHVLQNLNLRYRMQKIEDCAVFISNSFQIAKILVHFHICIHPLFYAVQANNLHKYHCRCFQWCKNVGGKRDVELRM